MASASFVARNMPRATSSSRVTWSSIGWLVSLSGHQPMIEW
ncbi:hypothetical protein [Nonomuraea aridisoli]|nr:hypothetical protein [Nonomuraea aridisoli]